MAYPDDSVLFTPNRITSVNLSQLLGTVILIPHISRQRYKLSHFLLIYLILSALVSLSSKELYGYFCEVIHSVRIVDP